MKKLRHQRSQEFQRKNYLLETAISEATDIIRMRLEMNDIGNNQGRKRLCRCGEGEETAEHIVNCITVARNMKAKILIKWIEK